MPNWNVSERAAKLHEQALVWDTHAGFSPFPDLDLTVIHAREARKPRRRDR